MNLKYLNLHTGINLKRGRDKILILGLMPGGGGAKHNSVVSLLGPRTCQ